MSKITMKSKDTIASSLAQCFVTINNKRYNFMNAIKFEAKIKKKKTKIPILGKSGGGNRTVGWEGTGTMTVHFNTSILRKMELEYMNTGKDFYFDITVTNEDPTNQLGRQTIKLLGCNTDEALLTKFDASSEGTIEEDISFTFEDAQMPEEFAQLVGLEG